MLEKLLEEIREELQKRGVNSYLIAIKNPDGDDEGFIFNGSTAWAVGMAELAKSDIVMGSLE
jgi:hypothetical protein